MFVKYISNIGPVSRIYKQFLQLKKSNNLLTISNTGKDIEQLELSNHPGRNVK